MKGQKLTERNKKPLWELWDPFKMLNIYVTEIPEVGVLEKISIFEEIMAKFFPNLMKTITLQM